MVSGVQTGSGTRPKWLRGQWDSYTLPSLKIHPIAMLYVCSGVTGLSNSIYIDTELTFDFDNFWIRRFPFFE